MCWEAPVVDTWLLALLAQDPHNIRLVAFLPVTGRKAKIGKGCPFQVFHIKQHFLQPLVHSIMDFWGGVFNIRLLVSFLPVTGVHWENERQNTLKLYLLIEGCSHITSAQMCSLILGKGSSRIKKTVKKGDIVPFWRPPPLNGSEGDICRLITEKSAWMGLATFWC